MKHTSKRLRRCDCGVEIESEFATLCQDCADDLEHDVAVDMFGPDADYLEHAGLADKIGNK